MNTTISNDDGEVWLIFFEDADKQPQIFSGLGATEAAHNMRAE